MGCASSSVGAGRIITNFSPSAVTSNPSVQVEDQSVLDSFLSHLKARKVPGRYRLEAYVLFAGFVSDMAAPSKSAWLNDYQRKVDVDGDGLITRDELEFVLNFEEENE